MDNAEDKGAGIARYIGNSGKHDVDVFFFFFQAEDGIQGSTVTGVQTCALPIFDVFETGV